jgi:hypothetical protein
MSRSETCSMRALKMTPGHVRTPPVQRISPVRAIPLVVSLVLGAPGATTPARAADPMPVLGVIGGAPRAFAVHGDIAVVGVGLTVSVLDVSEPEYREIARSAPLPGMVYPIAFDGDFAYAWLEAGEATDLAVLDLRDPRVPAPATTVGIGLGGDVALGAGRLYVGTGYERLDVFDVTDPRSPGLLGSYDDGNEWVHVVAREDTVYAVCRDWGPTWWLSIVDVSDPRRIRVLGRLPLGEGEDGLALAAVGDHLLAVLTAEMSTPTPSHLNVVDVSRPANPVLVARLDTRFNSLSELSADGTRVWVGGQLADRSYRYGLDGYDLTDPAAPARLGQGFQVPSEFDDLQAVTDRIFFLSGFILHGLDVIGATDPTTSGASAPYLTYARPVPAGDLVYVTGELPCHPDPSDTVTVAFDVRDPVHPLPALTVSGLARVAVLRVLSPTLVLVAGTERDATGSCTMKTIDVSSPNASTVLVARSEQGECADLAVSGARAYLAAGDRVHVVDVDAAGRLEPVGQIPVEGTARHVSVADRLAWVVSAGATRYGGTRSIEAFDINDPAVPRRLGGVSLTASVAPAIQGPSEVLAAGTLAWVADADRLRVLEVGVDDTVAEHPSIPVQRDADRLARDGNTLFVLGHQWETEWSLILFDVSDPRRPRRVTGLDQENAFPTFGANVFAERMAAAPGRLYLEASGAGVVVLDTSHTGNLPPPSPTATEVIVTATPLPPSPGPPSTRLFLPREDRASG